jgi:hypothetical protein
LIAQLHTLSTKPRNIWIGNQQAKGYDEADFHDTLRRYVPHTELDALLAELTQPKPANNPDLRDSSHFQSQRD